MTLRLYPPSELELSDIVQRYLTAQAEPAVLSSHPCLIPSLHVVHGSRGDRLLLGHRRTRCDSDLGLCSWLTWAAYTSLFLSTLPHTSLDAGTWVYSWVISQLKKRYVAPALIPSGPASSGRLVLYPQLKGAVASIAFRLSTVLPTRLLRLSPQFGESHVRPIPGSEFGSLPAFDRHSNSQRFSFSARSASSSSSPCK